MERHNSKQVAANLYDSSAWRISKGRCGGGARPKTCQLEY